MSSWFTYFLPILVILNVAGALGVIVLVHRGIERFKDRSIPKEGTSGGEQR